MKKFNWTAAGIILTIVLAVVVWIFGAGRHYTNVCKIPEIEKDVSTLKEVYIEQKTDIKYIKEGIGEIKRKLR